MSQRDLGGAVGLSQPSISRIESEDAPPDDVRILARIAQALEVSLTELLEGFEHPSARATPLVGQFYAFCPNPLCELNQRRRLEDGRLQVLWKSGQFHDAEEFGDINFCARCGEELVKDCPSCKRPLRDAGTRFCVACGTEVTSRPSEDDWAAIEKMLPKPPSPEEDDDLPF